jgi:AraC-like DNA-binding protein
MLARLTPLQEYIFNQTDEQEYKPLQTSVLTSISLRLLQQQIHSLLKDGYPPIDRVANIAGMSLRSFQRQLAKEHITYSLLIDQVRFETAVRLLQDPDPKLIEISLELGYNDPANFTRAFKRWTGMSPSQFRRLHGNS